MGDFISELYGFFFSKGRRIFLIPFFLVLFLCAFLFLFASGSAWAPFVYAIF
ncbi:DUF5989 family protein [Thalassospira mesophila]|uniref:DUF5989 family protein n=1 Tax=Thalassospira mesophila TaxID=1293891 RepID=UPI003CCB7A1A